MSEPPNETAQRRRESDRAGQRAAHALELGDHTAYLIATAQAEAARRRRAEWELERGVQEGGVRVLATVDAILPTVLRDT